MSSDIIPADSLRRTRSTGDLPSASAEVSRPDRAQTAVHRHSQSHPRPPLLIPSDLESPLPDPLVLSPRHTWSPVIPRVLEEEHIEMDIQMNMAPRRRRGLYSSILAFFGFGHAQESRKELVSFVLNLIWNSIQVIAIVVVLSVAAHTSSPTNPNLSQWQACNKPLGVWCSLWLIRANLSFTLAYWSWSRGRTPNVASDTESNNLTTARRARNTSDRRGVRQSTSGSGTNNGSNHTSPPSGMFNRLTVLYSMITLSWFLTAHVLEYTSVYTCRLSSPLLWWLTFSILSILYMKIIEIAFLGVAVFIVAPILFLFWNILLICLGRHPLQNPATMIKPEIEKLPKSVVDAIPLVMYIPPPPDDHTGGPITVPPNIYSYPPKPPITPTTPRRRFRFLRRKSPKDQKAANGSNSGKGDAVNAKSPDGDGPQSWEDRWEQGEYPFVRLEGNRAACAICLLDFAEPKRVANRAEAGADAQGEKDEECEKIAVEEEVVCDVIEEDRCGELKLTDAGEGPQPLRLLQCGHVFHKTCLDPWLQDVSGRCPLCQRAVVVALPDKKRRSRRT